MIACPTCGGETSVIETRQAPAGARRRRHCDSKECGNRFSTIEIVVSPGNRLDVAAVVVDIKTLSKLANKIMDAGLALASMGG